MHETFDTLFFIFRLARKLKCASKNCSENAEVELPGQMGKPAVSKTTLRGDRDVSL